MSKSHENHRWKHRSQHELYIKQQSVSLNAKHMKSINEPTDPNTNCDYDINIIQTISQQEKLMKIINETINLNTNCI